MYNLGILYQKGIACNQDNEKAFYWWFRAALGNFKPALEICAQNLQETFVEFDEIDNENSKKLGEAFLRVSGKDFELQDSIDKAKSYGFDISKESDSLMDLFI